MAQQVMQTLLREVGPGRVTGFFLVLARLSPLFVLAPLFSAKMLPTRVKGILAVALTIGMEPVVTHDLRIPSDPTTIVVLLAQNLLIGLAFAYVIAAVYSAIEMAGGLLDTVAGFSYGAVINPIDGTQGSVLQTLYGVVGLALFVAIGGDAWTLRGIERTFTLVPLTHAPQIASLTSGIVAAFGSIFVAGLEIAAPALLALFVTDIAFGMVSRVVPQLNVFAVGFPMKVGVALLVVGVSLPFLGGFMSSQIASAVTSAVQSI